MDEYWDNAGNPTFEPPVYITMCTDPVNYHSHSLFIDSETLDLNRQVDCSIVVIQNGKKLESDGFDDFSGPISAFCLFDD